MISEQVIGKTEAWFRHDSAIIPATFGKSAIAHEAHAIQRIAAALDDISIGIDLHGLRGVVRGWIEECNLVVGIVLRRDPRETHAVVQRQTVGQLPRILGIEFELVIAEFAQGSGGGLAEAVEVSQQGAGIGVAASGVCGTCAAAGWADIEAELPVDVAPRDLVLAIALVKHAELQGVPVVNPGEIIVQIDSRVGLVRGHGTEITAAKLSVIEATETHIRQSI